MILLAVVLRALEFPKAHQVPRDDETGYLIGGLLLLEGLPPPYKAAPAGPTTWLAFAYAAGSAITHLALPDEADRSLPWQIRPFAAINRALFELYRDITPLHRLVAAVSAAMSLAAVVAAARMGLARAGAAGALLLGGLAAALPLFVEYSCQARSYSMAWSLALVAWSVAAVHSGRHRRAITAVIMGLAIASRIEMVLLLPLILLEFIERPGLEPLVMTIWRLLRTTALTAVVMAPWLLTHLLGNLRTIATVRLTGPLQSASGWGVLSELSWAQGLGPLVIVVLVGVGLALSVRKVRLLLLYGYALLLLATSLLFGSGFGMRHDAPAVIALVGAGCYALGAWRARFPRSVWVAAGVAVALPAVQGVRQAIHDRRSIPVEASTAWIEEHVPDGARVFLVNEASMRLPLPTPEASQRLWAEVTSDAAWRRKFEAGLSRFNLSAGSLPRALSEENLVQDRGNYRRWFILGSPTTAPIPRYDLHVSGFSATFGLKDIESALAATDCWVVWRGSLEEKPAVLGDPIMQWVGRPDSSVYIFATPPKPTPRP